MLMHGDREVSTKNLARVLGVKTVAPCAPAVADRHSGYQVGGTSPFGTRRAMPVCMERSDVVGPFATINDWLQVMTLGVDARAAPAH